MKIKIHKKERSYMGDMTATDSYRVLLSGGEGEIVEKKSRFIATIRK